MKLILYHTDNRILEVVEKISSPSVEGSNVYWEGGSIHGTDLFLLLEENVELGEVVTDELKHLDRKNEFIKPPEKDLAKENEELRARLEAVEMATVTLMDFM